MSIEKEIQDVEMVVQNAANALGIKLHIAKSQFEDPTETFVVGIAQKDKTLLLRVPKRSYEEIRDNRNPHRFTELKTKLKKLLTSTN
jgi:hypothetical protein